MNKRQFIKRTGLGAMALGFMGGLSGCGGNVLTWAQTIIDAFQEALPIFQLLLPGQAVLIEKALEVSKELLTALKNKDPRAVDFLEQLIAPDGLFNQIIDTLGLITDPQQRAIVSGILLLADIALRLIAKDLQTAPAGLVVEARKRNAKAVKVVENAADLGILETKLKNLRF